MAPNLQSELDRIDSEILRLNAQRELLMRLLGRESSRPVVSQVPAETPAQARSRKYSLRPKNPANTQAILDAVSKHPGRTIKEIAEIVGKARGADAKELTQLYNTAYGLARRGKIVKDSEQRVSIPK